MYHYVRPLHNSKFPDIKGLELKKFENQINYFKRHYNFISVNEMLDAIYENKDVPKNSIVLTFDDGLKDGYTHVFPILKKFKIQGLFFPVGKTIEEKIVLDVHKIHFILATCNDKKNLVNEIFRIIDKNKIKFDLKTPHTYFSKLAVANRFDSKEIIFIKRILQRELPEELRVKIINDLFIKFLKTDDEEFSSKLYFSHEEMKEMLEDGMYFGSHSYSHPWLEFLETKQLEIELEKSHNFYSKLNKKKNDQIMCYPYGNFDKRVIEIIKNQGYKAGLTTKVGDSKLTKDEAFTLMRFDTNDFLKF